MACFYIPQIIYSAPATCPASAVLQATLGQHGGTSSGHWGEFLPPFQALSTSILDYLGPSRATSHCPLRQWPKRLVTTVQNRMY